MFATKRAVAVFSAISLAGCFGNPPFHAASESPPSQDVCVGIYKAFDEAVGPAPHQCGSLDAVTADAKGMADCLAGVVDSPKTGGSNNACWHTPSEAHTQAQIPYDLYFTEFDDQGWEADLRQKPDTRKTEIDNVFENLGKGLDENHPIDVVVFTHGWHGSSESDNYYVVLFRAFLEQLARIDQQETHPRRVVGIFVGWRGDSGLGFPAKYLSVWDRKLAAETVSTGAVQGLFERLHRFYLNHSCHPSGNHSVSGTEAKCGQVHMLTIGHSFGAIINFRSLLGNMETGLATPEGERVYSFGDLVVLLNPAFEGTRYAPLYYSAIRRLGGYVGPGKKYGGAQLPVVVTLQSKGDEATRYAFPLFREVTTSADNAIDGEKLQNVHAMGWVPEFATHRLCLSPSEPSPNFPNGAKRPTPSCKTLARSDGCDDSAASGDPNNSPYSCRINKKWAPNGPDENAFKIFGAKEPPVYVGDGMTLSTIPSEPEKQRPDYFPYWVVQVDKAVMLDHDDVWNPLTTSLILELYRAAVTQGEAQAKLINGEAVQQSAPTKE